MKILSWKFDDVKRIKSVLVTPSQSGMTILGGKNDEGKTSNIDVLAWMVGGDKFKPTEAKNRDSSKRPDLDVRTDNGLHITRKGKNSTLKVEQEDGTLGNQTLLNKFITTFALDLPKFRHASSNEKANLLAGTLGISEDLNKLEAEIKAAYEERRDLNRDKSKAETAFMACPKPEQPDTPKIDISKLTQELADAHKHNRDADQLEREKATAKNRINQQISSCEDLERQLTEAKETLAKYQQQYEETPDPAEPIDTDVIQQKIDAANEHNESISGFSTAQENWERLNQEYSKAAVSAHKAEKQLEQVRKQKDDLIAGADMPDPLLTIEDGELFYDGYAWDNLSKSKEVMVCAKIVMRFNPECKFILIDELENLDNSSLQELDEWFKEQGLQCIGTRVTEDADACTILIEDGMVKA